MELDLAVETVEGRGYYGASATGPGRHRWTGMTEVKYYRSRSEYGGLKGNQMRRLKELEVENKRFHRAGSDRTNKKLILKEAAELPERQRHQNF